MAAFRHSLWAIRKLIWSLHRRGAAGTLRIIFGRLKAGGYEPPSAPYEAHPFDLRHGVDTSGFVGGPNLRTGHRHDAYATAYWGVSPSRARDLLAKWQESAVRPLEEYSFIDIGCGKGRMLLIASELPFRRVIGVEFHHDLAATALRNAGKWALTGLARCPIEVICQDATELTLPDGPCVVFLYNPFGGPVLEALLSRFDEHFGERWGDLDVLYLVPDFAGAFQKREGYKLLWQANFRQSDGNEPEDIVASGWQPCHAYRR